MYRSAYLCEWYCCTIFGKRNNMKWELHGACAYKRSSRVRTYAERERKEKVTKTHVRHNNMWYRTVTSRPVKSLLTLPPPSPTLTLSFRSSYPTHAVRADFTINSTTQQPSLIRARAGSVRCSVPAFSLSLARYPRSSCTRWVGVTARRR